MAVKCILLKRPKKRCLYSQSSIREKCEENRKIKSMVTEEIGLNEVLEKEGHASDRNRFG